MDNFSNFTKSSRVERFNHLSFYNLMPYLVVKEKEISLKELKQEANNACAAVFSSSYSGVGGSSPNRYKVTSKQRVFISDLCGLLINLP